MENSNTIQLLAKTYSDNLQTLLNQMFYQLILQTMFLFAVIALQLNTSQLLSAEQPSRPNIVMILADDQSYRDFGFMGNTLVHTPHLDQLAAKSARFPNGYVPMSVCRPSLATLLTGLYPHQHGIHFNHPPPGLNSMREMTVSSNTCQSRTLDTRCADSPQTFDRYRLCLIPGRKALGRRFPKRRFHTWHDNRITSRYFRCNPRHPGAEKWRMGRAW